MVQVYGKPACGGCVATKKALEKVEVPYEYHDITADEQARQIVEQSGQLQLPLVIVGDDSWHGFRPDRVKALVNA